LGLDESDFTAAAPLRLVGAVGTGFYGMTFYFSGEVTCASVVPDRSRDISLAWQTELESLIPAEIWHDGGGRLFTARARRISHRRAGDVDAGGARHQAPRIHDVTSCRFAERASPPSATASSPTSYRLDNRNQTGGTKDSDEE
jgi:hypothetical protein